MSHALTAAKRTLELMRELLAMHKHEDPTYLIAHMKDVGRQMIEARPQGTCMAYPSRVLAGPECAKTDARICSSHPSVLL